MAIRVQNMPRKSVGQDSICTTPHLGSVPWWNLHDQQLSQTLSRNLSLRGKSAPQRGEEVKHLDILLEDQSSPSTQSSSQSEHGVASMGRTNSQDQCVSSESVQVESYGKHVDEQVKSSYLMSNLEFSVHQPPQPHPSQVEAIQLGAHIPYGYTDPYFNLYSAYGPQAMPQMMGFVPGRVPLPLDLAQESPIYVNAKQYNGILRRRQQRAKLEAQNKLVKGRKPYLHESRHQHALNRVRGSGGRFLSTKKQNQSGPTPSTVSDSASVPSHQKNDNIQEMEAERSKTIRQDASTTVNTSATGYMHSDIIFQPHDSRILNVSPQMAGPMSGVGGNIHKGMAHSASAAQ